MAFGKFFVGAVAAVLLASSAEAAVVYDQPTNNAGGFSSQNDTNNSVGIWTNFDNFTLGSSANLSSVSFVGSYFDGPPSTGAITGFTIAIYADNSGVPASSALYSVTLPGNGHETSLGPDNLGFPEFSYSENISFAALAGTEYWLSIVPDLGFPPQWAWENGTGGDGLGYQTYSLDATLNGATTADSAFALYDNTGQVPEPLTLSLFGAGLSGAVAMRRLRKRPA